MRSQPASLPLAVLEGMPQKVREAPSDSHAYHQARDVGHPACLVSGTPELRAEEDGAMALWARAADMGPEEAWRGMGPVSLGSSF